MKFFVCFLALLSYFLGKSNTVLNTCTSPRDTFYIIIPQKPVKGYMSVGVKQTRDTNAIAYIFGKFYPKPNDEQAFVLDVKKAGTVQNCLPPNSKTLSPPQVMDSILKHGRQFIRSNTFFAVFYKNEKYYIHPCKGEYLYGNYSEEY